jgi:hypothetical protein
VTALDGLWRQDAVRKTRPTCQTFKGAMHDHGDVVVQLQLLVQLSLSKARLVVRRNGDLWHKVVHLEVYALA